MAVLDAGAEEVKDNGDSFEIHSEPTDLQAIRDALKEAGIEYDTDEAEFVPSMQVPLDLDAARKFMKLVDALEELDDVQNVYSNADLSDEVRPHWKPSDVRWRSPGSCPDVMTCVSSASTRASPAAGIGVVDVERNRRATMVACRRGGHLPGRNASTSGCW